MPESEDQALYPAPLLVSRSMQISGGSSLLFKKKFLYIRIWGHKESDMIEQLGAHTHTHPESIYSVLVSGIQQSDSVIYIHISTLFQVLLPYRILQNVE